MGRIPTYQQMKDFAKEHFGFGLETCWIADVKTDLGFITRMAWNRIDPTKPSKPCPPYARPAILAALRHFGAIGSN
jgi:hypothetical protein